MTLAILHAASAALAGLALCISLYRIWRGPTIIDRNIATDVLSASTIAIVAVVIIGWQRHDLAVVLVIIALTGFLSSVVVARYIRRDVAKIHEATAPSPSPHICLVAHGSSANGLAPSGDDAPQAPRETVASDGGADRQHGRVDDEHSTRTIHTTQTDDEHSGDTLAGDEDDELIADDEEDTP